MNTITRLNQEIVNPFSGTFDNTPLDFNVEEAEVYVNRYSNQDPWASKDKKAVLKVTNEGIVEDWWIVGRDYPVKSHRKFYTSIEEQIVENMDPNHTKNVQVKTSVARNGRWGLRDYTFPGIQVPIETRQGFKTTVSLRIVAWSGLDGLTANNYMVGAIDNYCLNGMVFTQSVNKDTAYTKGYKRNTKNFDVDNFATYLSKATDIFYEQTDQYQKMATTGLFLTHGEAFIDRMKMSDKKKCFCITQCLDKLFEPC